MATAGCTVGGEERYRGGDEGTMLEALELVGLEIDGERRTNRRVCGNDALGPSWPRASALAVGAEVVSRRDRPDGAGGFLFGRGDEVHDRVRDSSVGAIVFC